jgi:diacylglycerol kinase family enzyme
MQVTPKAYIDDGLLDATVVGMFEMRDLGVIIEELQTFDNPDNQFVHYRQLESFEIEVQGTLPINLDGEPYRWDRIRFEIAPKALKVVLPEGCPVVRGP